MVRLVRTIDHRKAFGRTPGIIILPICAITVNSCIDVIQIGHILLARSAMAPSASNNPTSTAKTPHLVCSGRGSEKPVTTVATFAARNRAEIKRSGFAPRNRAYPQHSGSDSEKMMKYMSERPDHNWMARPFEQDYPAMAITFDFCGKSSLAVSKGCEGPKLISRRPMSVCA
jgi:hypothetical protein